MGDSDVSHHEGEFEPSNEEAKAKDKDDDDDDDGDMKPAAKPKPKIKKKSAKSERINDANIEDGKKQRRNLDEMRQDYKRHTHEMIFETPDARSYKGPVVDFHNLAGREWGQDSAFRYLPIPEIDNLVGWVTHISHNGTKDAHNNPVVQQESAQQDADSNPLLGIQPDGPLPFSYLESLLQDKARSILRGKSPGFDKTESESFECITASCDTSAMVAMGMILEEAITANLLPLAEYHVQRCRALEQQEERHEREQESLGIPLPVNYERESFHEWTLPPEEAIFNVMASSVPKLPQPAKVTANIADTINAANSDSNATHATIIAIEGSNTTTNTATAGVNNLIDVDIDVDTGDKVTTTKAAAANPIEANCLLDAGRGLLPSACHPTRSVHDESMQSHNPLEANFEEEAALQEAAAGLWCNRQKLPPRLVQENMDLFRWFVESKPPKRYQPKITTAAASAKKKAPPKKTASKKVTAKSKAKAATKPKPKAKAKLKAKIKIAAKPKGKPKPKTKSLAGMTASPAQKEEKDMEIEFEKKEAAEKEDSFLAMLSRDFLDGDSDDDE